MFVFGLGCCRPLFAAQVADLSRDGIGITVDAEPETVDPGRDFFVTVTVNAPAGQTATLPDLRTRFQGFQVAEDFAEDPLPAADGGTTLVSRWRLVPEPMAKKYRLAPLVVSVADQEPRATNHEPRAFYTVPVLFAPPVVRASVTGDMEIDPKRDLPPLSWKLVGICAAILAGVLLIAAIAYLVIRKIRTMVRIHRMSPIERAMYELEQLLKKGLPGRGFYKDFYVELTMVVRRYIERRHAVRAPNLTTDEFLRAARENPAFTREAIAELKNFLESADMVKFAGVEATPEMADAATGKARDYLTTDSAQPQEGGAK
ncbi:MAG: hypothetical protein IJI36_17250 [Kiritimatiellae bacterium]|nr:hypothetical protein [Kiritimatiellia bacterium]